MLNKEYEVINENEKLPRNVFLKKHKPSIIYVMPQFMEKHPWKPLFQERLHGNLIVKTLLDVILCRINKKNTNEWILLIYSFEKSNLSYMEGNCPQICRFSYNWDSLHARLNSHYEAWSYKKTKCKKVKAYKKSRELEDKRCLLTLNLKSFRS